MNQVNCVNCQNLLQYPKELGGKKIRCPKCQSVVQLPATSGPAPSAAQPARPAATPAPKPNPPQRTQPAARPAGQTQPRQPAPQGSRSAPARPAQPAAPGQRPAAPRPAANPQATGQAASPRSVPNQAARPANQPGNAPAGMAPLSPLQPAAYDPMAMPTDGLTPLTGAGPGGLFDQSGLQPLQPFGAAPGQPLPTAQPMHMPMAQPMPMMQPGMMQPGMMQPMAQPMPYHQPAYAQPRRKKGSGKALKLSLIWGGVGAVLLTLVILLLVFRPWEMFGGPQQVFYRLRTAMLNDDYGVLYDVMSEESLKAFDSMIDRVISMDVTGRLSEVKNLSGRQRFEKLIEIGQSRGVPIGRMKSSEADKERMRNTTIKEVKYNDDRTEATLILATPDQPDSPMRVVKESGGWKLGGRGFGF